MSKDNDSPGGDQGTWANQVTITWILSHHRVVVVKDQVVYRRIQAESVLNPGRITTELRLMHEAAGKFLAMRWLSRNESGLIAAVSSSISPSNISYRVAVRAHHPGTEGDKNTNITTRSSAFSSPHS